MKEYEEDQLSRSIWALGLGNIPSLAPPKRTASQQDMIHDLHFGGRPASLSVLGAISEIVLPLLLEGLEFF